MVRTLTVLQKLRFLELIHTISLIVILLYLFDYVRYQVYDLILLGIILLVTIIYKAYLRTTEEYDETKAKYRSGRTKHKDS